MQSAAKVKRYPTRDEILTKYGKNARCDVRVAVTRFPDNVHVLEHARIELHGGIADVPSLKQQRSEKTGRDRSSNPCYLSRMVLIKTRHIRFKDKIITLELQPDGSYKDDQGTTYPQFMFDPGFCGIWNAETGGWDPYHILACKPHDIAMAKLKLGYKDPSTSNVKAFGEFSKGVAVTMARGLYAVVMGIPYLVFGGIGGMLRWEYLENKIDNR